MVSFKNFITEETDTSDWMPDHELAKRIPKTAMRHIQQSKEHNILTRHDLALGGSGNLHYRIHTNSYGESFKTHAVQAASSKKDEDGFMHHVTYDLVRNSAHVRPGSHLKTNSRLKLILPFHKEVEINHSQRDGN